MENRILLLYAIMISLNCLNAEEGSMNGIGPQEHTGRCGFVGNVSPWRQTLRSRICTSHGQYLSSVPVACQSARGTLSSNPLNVYLYKLQGHSVSSKQHKP